MQCFWKLSVLAGTYLILVPTCLLLVLLERRKQDLSVPFCPGQCRFLVLRPLPGWIASLWGS